MFDCAKEILGYHNDCTTLPQNEREEMRSRRNSNRDRVKRGLEKNEKPKQKEFASQGSYSMRTMVQHPDNDYDIDDGIYFLKDDLIDANGVEMTALSTRQMIRDAVDDGGFKKPPEVRDNCVRVFYQTGYHVDLPSYREVTQENTQGENETFFELASIDWTRSDARDVTSWFDDQNKTQSPDDSNGRQLRRMARLIKKFATSRPDWKGQIGSGFMITKLVTEEYSSNINREDVSMHSTMKAIKERLDTDLVVKHPVTPDATITDGDADAKAIFLKDKLSDALADLAVLFKDDCTDADAMAAWDKVFNTTYFSDKLNEKKARAAANAGTIGGWGNEPQKPVDKRGGGRYA